jgi:ATP-dependent RNA helicase MSS116
LPSLTSARQLTTSVSRFQQTQAVSAQDAPAQSSFPTKFSELQNQIDPNLLTAITGDMGLVEMTEVQQRTLSEALSGKDVYVPFTVVFAISKC